MDETLKVGVITSTHGIRGEVKVFPTTDDPQRFLQLKTVILQTENEQRELKIEKVRFFKQFVIVKFIGIDHINDIEQYKGSGLFVTRKNAVPLEEGEYFIADLIGLRVISDEGKPLGILKEVLQTGANDVYIIEGEQTKDIVNKEILIPAIRQCIQNIDLAEGIMKVHVMEGLLDE